MGGKAQRRKRIKRQAGGYIFFIRKSSTRMPIAEPPTAGLTGTLGTKGGGFLPFQALRSTDSV